MITPIMTDEIEEYVNRIGFLSYLLREEHGVRDLEPVVSAYGGYLDCVKKLNRYIDSYNSGNERLEKLVDDGKLEVFDTFLMLNETLDLSFLNGLYGEYHEEIKPLPELFSGIDSYLEQEILREGIPRSRLDQLKEDVVEEAEGILKKEANLERKRLLKRK